MILRQTVPRATCEHTRPGSRPLDNHSNKRWSYQIASLGKWDVADGPAALEQKLMVNWGQEGDPLGPGPCLGSFFPGPILQLTCINYQTYFICMAFLLFRPTTHELLWHVSCLKDWGLYYESDRCQGEGRQGNNYSVFQQHLASTLRCGIFE